MASGRFSSFPANATYVAPPAFQPVGGGILDKADLREVASGAPELRGYKFESELNEVALGTVTGYLQSATDAMAEGLSHQYVNSFDPLTVFGAAATDAGAGDTVDELVARAKRRLMLGEGLAVERALWEAGGLLPTKATVVRTGALKAKLATGLLAEWWAQSNNGLPYFHGGRRIVNEVAAQQLLDFDAEEAALKGGASIVNGAGYFAKTTISGVTPTADQVWLYITGKPVLYRGSVGATGAHGAQGAVATANNRETAFALRTYVPAVDGPVGVVLVDLTL